MQGSGLLLGLVPLFTAGFLFVITCYVTRLRAVTAEGQKLFFMCAAAGLAIGTVSFPLFRNIAPVSVVSWFDENYPFPADEAGALMLALCLAPVIAWCVNGVLWLWYRLPGQNPGGLPLWHCLFTRMAKRNGSPLQQLLIDAIEGQKLVMFSLGSRKVYCGYVVRMPPIFRNEDQYIEVIPLFSTARDKDTLKLLDWLSYPAVLYWRARNWRDQLRSVHEASGDSAGAVSPEGREILANLLQQADEKLLAFEVADEEGYLRDLRIEDWAKVIPIDQIESASVFDENAHRQWFATTGTAELATR
jgi:hypothetical protein